MIKTKLAAFLLFFAFFVPVTTVVANPATAYACPNDTLFLVPAWYNGLQTGDCKNIAKIGNQKDDLRNFAIKVALNIVRAAFVVAGYAAVFFIIKGGFLYILARGDPGHITSAKQTITNAVIGLIICILASAIVAAIGGAIKTS